ncbi:unnamed protein product [Blepharisma stoltei]|uniref:RING-type domain-containing protein n=1 Tax=Blepharisma stoltei TaxID=1481888 RepID=A0AAU9JMJ0_9CILI|nr:unnamed protein product [Blepharisma stoltei]
MVDASVFECGLCLQPYNEGAHKPVSLPCGHVFCQECTIKQSRIDHIVCPIDKTRHDVNPYQLPCCFAILANLPTHKPKEVCCSRHPKRKIKFQCKTHEKYLCSECIIEHTGSGHNVVAFSISVNMIRQEMNEIEEAFEFRYEEIDEIAKNLEKTEKSFKDFYDKEMAKISNEYDSAIKVLQQRKKDQIAALLKCMEEQGKLLEKTKAKVMKVVDSSSRVKQEIGSLREHFNTQSYEQFSNQVRLIKQELKYIESSEQVPDIQYWSLKDQIQISGGTIQQVLAEDDSLKENRYRYLEDSNGKAKNCHHKKTPPKLALQNVSQPEQEITSVTSRAQDEKVTRLPSSTEKELSEVSTLDKSERGRSAMPDRPNNQIPSKAQVARNRHQRRNGQRKRNNSL